MRHATLPPTWEDRVFNNESGFNARYSRRFEMSALAAFLLVCLAAELSAGLVAAPALHGWLLSLATPPFAPPASAYFPIWTAVYLLAGLAAWQIWRVPDVGLLNHRALSIWGWQLGAKALWTSLFFGLHWMLPAAAAGAATLVVLAFTLQRFYRLNRLAAALMLPYAVWAIFELYLNAGFWWLNP